MWRLRQPVEQFAVVMVGNLIDSVNDNENGLAFLTRLDENALRLVLKFLTQALISFDAVQVV